MQAIITLPNVITRHEIVVEKSRFIATATRVANVAAANALINQVTKTYPDATHHCYAYVTVDGQKFTDAGEPQGTAGLPIFNAITKQQLSQVIVIVSRYFGGIKLGTGGLARAYGRVTAEVLALAGKVTLKECAIWQITSTYVQAPLIETLSLKYGKVLTKEYLAQIQFTLAIPQAQTVVFQQELTQIFHGEPPIKILPNTMIEF